MLLGLLETDAFLVLHDALCGPLLIVQRECRGLFRFTDKFANHSIRYPHPYAPWDAHQHHQHDGVCLFPNKERANHEDGLKESAERPDRPQTQTACAPWL